MQQMVNIGKNISNLLESKNMTQRELANRVGVTEVTIGRYINGTREPNGTTLKNIATALNTSTDYLLGNEQSEYYIDEDTAELAQEIFEDRNLRILMSASRKLQKQDLEALIKIVNSMAPPEPEGDY